MGLKHIKLSDDILILFNQVKSIIVRENPKMKRVTDEFVIKEALKKFLEVKNGRKE